MLAAVRVVRSLRLPTTSSSFRCFRTTPNLTYVVQKDLLINLDAGIDDPSTPPPTAGPDGYPPPKPTVNRNPMDKVTRKEYAPEKPQYHLYCQSTRNNTITTLMSNKQQPLAAFSGGSCKFKKVNRSSYEAGYQCAVRMFRVIEELAENKQFVIHLYFKGFGQGRDAMHKALLAAEGARVRPLVAMLTDRTPIKIGGTRAKKARRL